MVSEYFIFFSRNLYITIIHYSIWPWCSNKVKPIILFLIIYFYQEVRKPLSLSANDHWYISGSFLTSFTIINYFFIIIIMFSAYRRPMHINRYSLPNTMCGISHARLFTPEILDEVIWTMFSLFFRIRWTLRTKSDIVFCWSTYTHRSSIKFRRSKLIDDNKNAC